MLFKGRLRLPNDPGEGIPIDLELEDVFLSLESEGEDFGEWRLDTVEINRLFSNQFAMQLDGEEMVFVADDALGFAYEGLSAIEDVKSRLSKRRIFKGRKPKKMAVADRSEPDVVETESEEPMAVPTSPDAPMPEVVPFFPESSPSFAESVAESAVDDESIAPVAAKPIELSDATPAPSHAASEPSVQTSPPVEPEPVVQTQPPVAAQPPSTVDQPAASLETTGEVDIPLEDEDDELVIEDVSAYGYVPVATAPVEQQPALAEPEPSEDELEIEDAAPATGAVLRELHPLGEPAPTPVAEVHPLGAPVEQEPPVSTEPEPLDDTPPAAPTHGAAPAVEAPPPVTEPAPVPLPPDGDSSFFEQWSSNGRGASEPELMPEPAMELNDEHQDRSGPQTQKSGRHARSSGRSRSSLFGRKQSREPEAHEHRYESSKTVGGITRRVCSICGHVSFAGEDVYQDW